MTVKQMLLAFCAAIAVSTTTFAQSYTPATIKMFRDLQAQPNDLARYIYLVSLLPELGPSDRQIAMQMFSSVEDELGLYNEAIRDFPLKSRIPESVKLPTPTEWKSASASDVVTTMALGRQIVLINEAHHDAHTRQLTLELLPKLRALGFNYFAAEALVATDPALMKRGYPTKQSGTEYLHEPSYGDMIRLAIKLGYKIIPYDIDERTQQQREAGQAENLYGKIFKNDPKARLLVHAGYAHIDKAKGRLNNIEPMAMHLQALTGIEPLSIDQTQFREQLPRERDAYLHLTETFPIKGPTVLINRTTGQPWSAHPDMYDANVILPPTEPNAVDSGYVQASAIVHNMVRSQDMLSHYVETKRPEWLVLDDDRLPYAISTSLCKVTIPCVVDAHYINEPDVAIPADRYAFLQNDSISKLYLRPGSYRLRAWDARGKTLSERTITVGAR